MRKKYIIIICIVVLFAYLIIHRIVINKAQAEKGASKGHKDGLSTMKVEGYIVHPQNFENKISLTGSVEANEQVEIRSQVAGIIEKLNFKEGGSVEKGQILIKIEDSELRARMLEAKTREVQARENEQRAKQLLAKEAISRQEYEVAQADLKSFEAQSQLVKAQLDKTEVRAPFAGKIGLRKVSQGSYLSADIVIANLVDDDPVKITFSMPEKYANKLKLNSPLDFTIAGSNDPISGNVFAIEPAVNAATRTIEVKAIASNKAGKILPGSFANISLPLTSVSNALLIPSESIIPIQNGKKVFIVKEGKAREVKINTSVRTKDKVLVESGIQAGDTVLTSGVMTLKDNTPVEVNIP